MFKPDFSKQVANREGYGAALRELAKKDKNLIALDADLAQLYQVPTFRFNEAVKRNRKRFPEDFMFQLTAQENESLKSHFAMSKGRGGRRRGVQPKYLCRCCQTVLSD